MVWSVNSSGLKQASLKVWFGYAYGDCLESSCAARHNFCGHRQAHL